MYQVYAIHLSSSSNFIRFNDILVASPFLNKKVPIQDCTTPTKVMWLSATLSAAVRGYAILKLHFLRIW